jgi:MFS family permease
MTTLEGQTQKKLREKLFNFNFSVLWTGQFVRCFGDQFFSIALMLWVKQATDSATIMGMIMMVSTLPGVLLGPLGGAASDRYSRRRIILLSSFLVGISVLLLALAMYIFPEYTQLSIVFLFITSTAIAIGNAFFSPAIAASIPDLVPESRVANANSLSQLSYQLSVFVGQGGGGVLFRVLGAPLLFLINAIAYFVATISAALITIPQKVPEKVKTFKETLQVFWQDTLEGLRYVRDKAGLRELVLLSALQNFFFVPIILLFPFYIEDVLLLTEDWYGFILAVYGSGAVAGYLLAGAIQVSPRKRSIIVISFLMFESLGYIFLGMARTSTTAMILSFMGGAVTGVVQVYIITLLQISTPGTIRGRVFGLLSTIAGSITPIAMGLTGVIADLLDQNIPVIYGACGVILFIIASVMSLRPDFRAYLAYEVPTGGKVEAPEGEKAAVEDEEGEMKE